VRYNAISLASHIYAVGNEDDCGGEEYARVVGVGIANGSGRWVDELARVPLDVDYRQEYQAVAGTGKYRSQNCTEYPSILAYLQPC